MNYYNVPSVSSELLIAEREILTRVAAGGALSEVMRDIILMVEKPSRGDMLASILRLTEDGKRLREGAAPSQPADYNAAIDGIAIGYGVGSCGTAAYTGQPVIVSDIATDPLWANFRELALAHDLRACWSMPIHAADGRLLGTFANYYRKPREPTERHLETIGMVTRTAAIAIERSLNQQARERAEAQRNLLLRELNHRVKNVFALADSLLMMSARSATSVEGYSAAVRGRLAALNRAHELVQPGLADVEKPDTRAVPLKRLVADILAPYVQAGSDKFVLAGPDDFEISYRSLTGIALILHELATNAAKYGALGHPDGRLHVSWEVTGGLRLEWCERGGPVAAPPSKTGFGGQLIRRTVEIQFGGTIDYRWESEGLTIAIRLPSIFV